MRRPLKESFVGRRHETEEKTTVIGNLHGGAAERLAERRAGSGGTSIDTNACVAYGTTLLWRRRQIRCDGVGLAHGV